MRTKVLGLVVVFLAWCGATAVPAGADVLRVHPSEVVALSEGGSGTTRVGLRFDLSGMRQGVGLEIIVAHLDCRLDAMPADRETRYAVFPVVEPWTSSEVGRGSGSPVVLESQAVEWCFSPADYERLQGGFVRFDLGGIVEMWLDGTLANNGLVIATGDVGAEVLGGALRGSELIVRYGFVKRE